MRVARRLSTTIAVIAIATLVAAAGAEVMQCYRVLSKTGDNVVGDVLRDACQSASKVDPLSACNIDPLARWFGRPEAMRGALA